MPSQIYSWGWELKEYGDEMRIGYDIGPEISEALKCGSGSTHFVAGTGFVACNALNIIT